MISASYDILSVTETAKILCVGKRKVYELLESNQIKGFRLGHVWKIPKQAVEEYIITQSGLQN